MWLTDWPLHVTLKLISTMIRNPPFLGFFWNRARSWTLVQVPGVAGKVQEVATNRRLPKIIGLFCKRALWVRSESLVLKSPAIWKGLVLQISHTNIEFVSKRGLIILNLLLGYYSSTPYSLKLWASSYGTSSPHAQMLMIAVITLNCSLVPLIEGLSFSYVSSHPCAFEFSVVRSHFWLFFVGRQNVLKKKSNYSKVSSRLPAITVYTCVLCTHVRIHI